MLSSPTKFKKFRKTLSYTPASWLADAHTYVSDKTTQLRARAKRRQDALADWDLHLVTFNKMFIEWVAEQGNDELAEKVSVAAYDDHLNPITKDYRVSWRLERNFPDVDWSTKTKEYQDTQFEGVV